MDRILSRPHAPAAKLARLLACAACSIALLGAVTSAAWGAKGRASATGQVTTPLVGGASATVEQCLATGEQAERSATFTGEMTAIPGSVRMSMRIDVEERAPGEAEFHAVTASGLGVWRPSDPKVKVYKYLKQVGNLAAPASYRGVVHFRWLNAHGHAIKRAERLTMRCLQPQATTEALSGGDAPAGTSSSTKTIAGNA